MFFCQFAEELKRAQKIRRNRLEYDALSKVIKEFPDRMTTAARLQEIEAELDKSRAEEEALDEKLLQRKKQFHLLIHTIHQVNALGQWFTKSAPRTSDGPRD